jgi:hypothetical protein
MNKNIRINLGEIASILNQEQFGLLIDAMVEQYATLYGLENIDLEPDAPDYSQENTTLASEYLKKFRLK